MMGNFWEKLLLLEKQKGNVTGFSEENKCVVEHRFLIIVNVLGSCGPIKYVVKEDDSVAAVIRTALKLYARQERLPVLGSDASKCLLYPSNGQQDALRPDEMIGAGGVRNFVLCKKQRQQQLLEDELIRAQRKTSCWKSLISRYFYYVLGSW